MLCLSFGSILIILVIILVMLESGSRSNARYFASISKLPFLYLIRLGRSNSGRPFLKISAMIQPTEKMSILCRSLLV